MPNQEHERERYQTHSYWYIPSAPRVNYSLIVMESARMMKMATGEGSPLRQGARTGLDWFSVATKACGGGIPDLSLSLMVLGYMGIYRRKKSVGGATRGPREWRARPPISWPPRGPPDLFPTPTPLIYTQTSRKKPRSGVPPLQASIATKNQSRPIPHTAGGGNPHRWLSSSSRRSP